MSQRADRDELTLLLARAFDRAWSRYYRSGRTVFVAKAIARSSLAAHLIKLAKVGLRDEVVLAEDGVRHLVSMTPSSWGEVRIESAGAKFVRPWRVRTDRLRFPID